MFGLMDFNGRDRNLSGIITNICIREDEWKSYGFETTWEWINDDGFFFYILLWFLHKTIVWLQNLVFMFLNYLYLTFFGT